MKNITSLPQLDIAQSSSPRGLSIILVQLLDLFYAQRPPSRDKVGSLRVAPRSAESKLVDRGEHYNQNDAERVLEKVCGRELGVALLAVSPMGLSEMDM